MIICICARVSDKTIEQAARAGRSFDDLQADHGVALQCGQCHDCARHLWQRCNGVAGAARSCDDAQLMAV
jgi:bacterioferritin-associated ferredoxin